MQVYINLQIFIMIEKINYSNDQNKMDNNTNATINSESTWLSRSPASVCVLLSGWKEK